MIYWVDESMNQSGRAWMNAYMHEWMEWMEWMNPWMNSWIDECMDEWMKYYEMEWNGMEWHGTDRTERNGMELEYGMEWNEVVSRWIR